MVKPPKMRGDTAIPVPLPLDDIAKTVTVGTDALRMATTARNETIQRRAKLTSRRGAIVAMLHKARAEAEADRLTGRDHSPAAVEAVAAELAEVDQEIAGLDTARQQALIAVLVGRLEEGRGLLVMAFDAEAQAFEAEAISQVHAAIDLLRSALADLSAVQMWSPDPHTFKLNMPGLPDSLAGIEPPPPKPEAKRFADVLTVMTRAERALMRAAI